MTAEAVPGQAGAAPGGAAEPGPARSGLDRVARYGVWAAVITHIVLHDRRFQAAVVTGAIGAYALGSVTKDNQARPLRRVTAWYSVQGQARDVKVLRRGRRALLPGRRQARDDHGSLSRGVETAMLKLLYKPVAIVAGIVANPGRRP